VITVTGHGGRGAAGWPGAGRRRMARRRLLVLAALLVLLVLAAAASVAIGSYRVPPGAVWDALWSPTGSADDIRVRSLRLPRTALGVLVGLALGAAGALMQGHTRNPLADPGLLGVNAGATLAVVLAIYGLGVDSLLGYVWFAFAGALAATVLVVLLGSAGRGGPTPVTLALAGAAVSALFGALTSAVVLLDSQTLDAYRFWAVGALAERKLDVLLPVSPFVAAGLVLALLNARALNSLALGEDTARSLGLRIGVARGVGVAAVTLLAGAAVAACGPIGFVGLVVPHLVRAMVGADHRWLVPCAALAGAVLVLAADVLGRVVAPPGELAVGIVLALVGAPFFIALVRRSRLVRL
jgi:iron complex transport system permease protein